LLLNQIVLSLLDEEEEVLGSVCSCLEANTNDEKCSGRNDWRSQEPDISAKPDYDRVAYFSVIYPELSRPV
jgi:hypothetical protein